MMFDFLARRPAVVGLAVFAAGLTFVSGPARADDDAWMGRVWRVLESGAEGKYCEATWHRVGTTNRFEGEWRCSDGARATDTLVVRLHEDNRVMVLREGVKEHYRGTLSQDRAAIDGSGWKTGQRWIVQIKK